jgi:glycosyltransferase involved in cell wall biosynthesis
MDMTLGIVVPCYNEEEVLEETARRLVEFLAGLSEKGKIFAQSRIYFIDDGSHDQTWQIIESLAQADEMIHGVKLSGNQGHQRALLAGLSITSEEMIISIDADLQDDITVIEEMVDAFNQGYDIVYGVRNNRSVDTLFKRFCAEAYYRLLRTMGVNVVFNHADYRLLSRRALDQLMQFRETNLYLRGMVLLLGFKSTSVYYTRAQRFAGTTKYPVRKSVALAIDGITSFSVVPLRMITFLGLLVFLMSLAFGLWSLWVRLFTDHAIPGWASTVIPVYFLGAIQLLGIGIIGEYLGKIYLEVKARPRYIIEKKI